MTESVSYMRIVEKSQGPMREFASGATRSSDAGKNDYEGFLSPLFLEGYGDYMTIHRVQTDGKLRASDNWQKGMSIESYKKSMWRHFMAAWAIWRGWPVKAEAFGLVMRQPTLLESLYALAFNLMGLVHELRKQELAKGQLDTVAPTAAPNSGGALQGIQGNEDYFRKLQEIARQQQAERDAAEIIGKPWPDILKKPGPYEASLNEVPKVSRYGGPAIGKGGSL